VADSIPLSDKSAGYRLRFAGEPVAYGAESGKAIELLSMATEF
jgi:hypothetical protein